MVFRQSSYWFVPTPQDQYWAGYIPQEFAQFYMDFQANWTLQEMELHQALDDACTIARGKNSPLQNPPWRVNCADTIGLTKLHLNEFNAYSATW